jgi:hypothetical protein
MLRPHQGRRRDRGPVPERPSGAGRLSYANIIASIALFVALGGTGVAAVTLGRDSVGSPQIRKDAVRSPELASDAVRSPEISSGAVRSSEIRDEAINVADISSRARTELRGALKLAQDETSRDAPTCEGDDLSRCPNQLELQLATSATSGSGGRQEDPGPAGPGGPEPGPQVPEAGRNWLVQAKLHIVAGKGAGEVGSQDHTVNRCGLVNIAVTGPRAVLDQVPVGGSVGRLSENLALSAFVSKRATNPTVALRCTSQPGDQVSPSFVKITALEVGTAPAR